MIQQKKKKREYYSKCMSEKFIHHTQWRLNSFTEL